MGIVATDATRFLDGFYRLGVHNACTRVRVPADTPTFGLVQRTVDERPEARAAKLPPMVVNRLKGAGSCSASSAKDSPCAAHKKAH
jgi:hypothetical protein